MNKYTRSLILGSALICASNSYAGFWSTLRDTIIHPVRTMHRTAETLTDTVEAIVSNQKIEAEYLRVIKNPKLYHTDSFSDNILHWCGTPIKGNKVLVSVNADGDNDLYEITNGKDVRRLTNNGAIEISPLYGHDGHISWRQNNGNDTEYWQLHGTTPTLITTRNTHFK